MKKNSIWSDTIKIKDFPTLNQDISTDVLVIGGGVVGILCAYELSKRNIKCIVVEKDKIGSGTTKDTTAFITAQHEILYQDLIKNEGIQKAKEYLELNLQALNKYKELSKIYDFDFQECDSTLYSTMSKNLILKEKEALNSLGYETKIIEKVPFNINIEAGISFPNQGILHPLKLIKELSKDLNIYEHTMIHKLKDNFAYTKNGNKIHFKNVIIATHYPFRNITGLYFAKLTQRRSYVVAIKEDKVLNTYCGIDDDAIYFRGYNNYLILGGSDRDNKEKLDLAFNKKIQTILEDKEIEYSWSGQDTITVDGIPYIGRYDIFHKNYYVATGFNLWGFTWAMASSFILADMIEGKREYPLVNPRRSCVKKQLFVNLKTAIKHLVSFKKPRCAHMGCVLKYNKIEHVWECPCHGSRYDENGNVLDGPTLKNKDF